MEDWTTLYYSPSLIINKYWTIVFTYVDIFRPFTSTRSIYDFLCVVCVFECAVVVSMLINRKVCMYVSYLYFLMLFQAQTFDVGNSLADRDELISTLNLNALFSD